MMYPFLYIFSMSLQDTASLTMIGSMIPEKIDFTAYIKVFNDHYIRTGFINSLQRTALAVPLTLVATMFIAYPLSKKYFPNRSFWTGFVVFTMFFNGGMIPTYILIKNLHLFNTIWALILPVLVNTFHMIIMRNYFMSLPDSLEESAKIDGAGDFTILFRIIFPIAKPIVATICLWTAVYHWNAFFDSMIYIADGDKHVLQMVLRRIVIEGSSTTNEILGQETDTVSPGNIKAAAIMITSLPIIMVYPFAQKYFVKGVMVGSLKG